ncbi:hypothetical protein IFT84_13055 [Rhizobium sp. CFBP 8762]|uniref:hypothetical protein n=1 Tax=Rhizobium sp. CFBP 8762 TaxID=2775279 RepID=UPI00177F9263|nr:hypothetical protein [Rhizobium sp. CFBP 8762]MBD8555433.1 hypothetical protein [Rhizobium sp. CFBP 8762]
MSNVVQAAAEGIPGKYPVGSSLAELVAYHAPIRQSILAMDAQITHLGNQPDAPPMACVTLSEVDPRKFRAGMSFNTASAIDEHFDTEVHNLSELTSDRPAAHYLERLKVLNGWRKHAHELLAERQGAYAAWEASSGLEQLHDEFDRLSALESDADEAILRWQCRTMDEVQLKARHIQTAYNGKLSRNYLNMVIDSLANPPVAQPVGAQPVVAAPVVSDPAIDKMDLAIDLLQMTWLAVNTDGGPSDSDIRSLSNAVAHVIEILTPVRSVVNRLHQEDQA